MKNFFFGGKRGRKTGEKPVGLPEPGESTIYLTGDDRVDSAKIKILLDTMAELISSVEPDRLLRTIVDRCIRIVSAERGILFLKDSGDALRIKVARDAEGRDLTGNIQYSTGVLKKVVETGKPVHLKVGASEVADLSQSVVDLKLRAVMCVTLSVKNRVLGCIYVDSRATSRDFKKSDLKFFDALANAMAITLDNARLVAEYVAGERLKKSMEIARGIQQGLLPKSPVTLRGFDIAGSLRPVEAAAGDYFDLLRIPPDRYGIVVGDVTGHGIGPALVMSSARAMIRGLASSEIRLDELLARLNDHLDRDTDAGMFMSLFLGAIDLRERTLVYGSAGHPPQLLYRGETDAFIELPRTGMALGIEEGIPFRASEPVPLMPGDLIVLYTDGIVEARGQEGECFGLERLKGLLVELKDRPAQEIVDTILDRVEDFILEEEAKDDLTLVAVRVTE